MKAGSLPVSPGSKRRFSNSSTPGASSASRSRTGSIENDGSGTPFGRPRWLAGDDLRVAPGEPLDRREGGPDPEVVGDLAVVERDVEVGADQDPLPRESIEFGLEILERGDVAHRVFATFAPANTARSTRRFE